MMIKLLLLPFILLSINVMAQCHIEFYDYTYYSSSHKVTAQNLFKKSTCSTTINLRAVELLHEQNQWGYARHIKNLLQEQNRTQITITPQKFYIGQLENWIASNLDLGKDRKIQLKNGSFPSLVQLGRTQVAELSFQDLPRGRKQVHLKTNSKNYWFTVDILKYRKVPIASQTIMPYSPLHGVRWETRWVSSNENYLDTPQVHFYQSNKSISQGSPIKVADIFPRTLVKAGIPTKVVLRNGAIKLETVALPYTSGKYGDSIAFRNIKTGKKITAKVTNENEATIQL